MSDKDKNLKLNSMRLLEAHNIPYTVRLYDDSKHDEEHRTAVDVAAIIGEPVENLYKTLVVENVAGGKPMLVMIGAAKTLNLKKLAAAVGTKKVQMAAHDAAEHATGLKTGGIGALALVHKGWAVYLDQAAQTLDTICVSAGLRGVNLKVPTLDLVRVVKARWVDCAE